MPRLLCKNCKEKWTISLYCSKECSYEWKFKKAQKKLSVIPCKQCGTLFQPLGKQHVYCSKDCNSIATKIRVFRINSSDFSIFKRDNFTCIYCGKSSIEDKVKLNVDHIVPFSLSGEMAIDNLVTSCKLCNIQKGASLLGKVDIERIKSVIARRNKEISDMQMNIINIEIDKLIKSRNGC